MIIVGCWVLGGCGVQHSTPSASQPVPHTDGTTASSSDESRKDSKDTPLGDTDQPSFLQAWNGGVYRFNRLLDKTILRPVHFVFSCLPRCVKRGIYNFLSNLERPVSMANAVLQLNPKAFFDHTCCFVLNTTVGMGGLVNVAGNGLNLRPKRIEFGDTLYKAFGLPSGPLVMVPVIGPLMVRDFVSRPVDFFAMPTTYLPIDRWIYFGMKFVEEKSRSIDIENAMEKSFSDPMRIIERMYKDRQALRHDATDGADPVVDALDDLDDDDDDTPSDDTDSDASSTTAKKGDASQAKESPDNGDDLVADALDDLDDDTDSA